MHGTKKCDLLKWPKDRRFCRFCRFQKCKEIGMSLNLGKKLLYKS